MSSQLSFPLATRLGGDDQELPATVTATNILGTDIAYSAGLVVERGDYKLVSGFENLQASIYRRLITSPGEYKAKPNYGCGFKQAVKQLASQTNISALKVRAKQQLLSERRIDSVEIELSISNNILTSLITIVSKGKNITLEFKIQ